MTKNALKLVSFLSLVLAVALFAPQRAKADDDDDPPTRVARLSYTHGEVSFNPAGTDDWVSAVVNRPITTGDKLWTDNRARAELHMGSAAIRLSSNTGFSFLNLSDNIAQIRVTEGTIVIRVRNLGEQETFEVDTPNLAFSILRPGRYRIRVNGEGDSTMVAVRDGEGEVTGGGAAYTIHPRETGTFNGLDQVDADIQPYGDDEDDFDHFCNDRDRREDRSISSRYVSRDVVGYEDLDDYGGWRPVPEYGTVWFPHTVVVGWAPYRYGHWVWISPWGWTWVEDEPWGFAPFHYGRWVVVGGVWGWVPCPPAPVVAGVAYVRPVYAPALVAWVGGPHFSIAIGVGGGGGVGVAWFPLGPREVYVPSYRVSRTYVNNVNVTNTTVNNTYVTNVYNNTVINNTVINKTTNNVNVTNIKYVNQSVPGAVTATSHTAFTSAQPVAKNMVKVDAREVASAQVTTAASIAAPPKQAVLGAGTPAAVKPPAAIANRAVVAKVAPPPPPASFEKQQEAIKANGGRPITMTQVRELPADRIHSAVPPVKIAPAVNPGAMQNAQGNRGGNPQINQGNRPGTPVNAGQPPVNAANKPVTGNNPPPSPGNAKVYNDRPPVSRPNTPSNVNMRVDQQQQRQQQEQQLRMKQDEERQKMAQQQQEQLRNRQDQERQRVEQQQMAERQKLQQRNVDEQRQQQMEQKHQQQLEQLERKHDQEQQKLQQKQQKQEAPKEKPSKPPKEDKPHGH